MRKIPNKKTPEAAGSGPLAFPALCIALICLCLMAGCGPNGNGQDHVVAKVNGKVMTLEDFQAISAYMGLGSDPVILTTDLRQAVLDSLVIQDLILREAARLGIRITPEEMAKEEAGARKDMTEESFQNNLATQGVTPEVWRDQLGRELTVQKTLDLVLAPKIRVTPEEVRNYYEKHQNQFQRPERVLAKHAVLPTLGLAQKLLNRVEKGEDMAQAAEDLGSPMPEGGEPTWLSRGHMPPDLEDKIFNLSPGKPAGPLDSAYGYHVVLVLEKKPAVLINVSEAAEEIQKRLSARQREKLAVGWIEDLKKGADIWIDPQFENSGFLP